MPDSSQAAQKNRFLKMNQAWLKKEEEPRRIRRAREETRIC